KVAAGEEAFDALQKRRIDRERIGEGAMNRARLFHHDLAVAFEDVSLDLADVILDERIDRLFTGEDATTSFFDTGRTERIRDAGPAEGWLRTLPALQERRGRPVRLKRLAFETPVNGLNHRPRRPSGVCHYCLQWPPHIHASLSCESRRRGGWSAANSRQKCPELARNYNTPLLPPRWSATRVSRARRLVLPRSSRGIASRNRYSRGTLWAASRAAQKRRTSMAVNARERARRQAPNN